MMQPTVMPAAENWLGESSLNKQLPGSRSSAGLQSGPQPAAGRRLRFAGLDVLDPLMDKAIDQ